MSYSFVVHHHDLAYCGVLLLEFFKSFDGWHVHNMMVIMLVPHFQALCFVENLVEHGDVILLTFDYDVKVVIPLLMVWYDQLKPIDNASNVVIVDATKLDLEKKVWFGGFNWIKMLLDHNFHHKITFKGKLLKVNPWTKFQWKYMLMGNYLV